MRVTNKQTHAPTMNANTVVNTMTNTMTNAASSLRNAGVVLTGTLLAVLLNPVAALAHDEEPLPLPEVTSSPVAETSVDGNGSPNLLIAGAVLLAALAGGAVIAGKLTKRKTLPDEA